MVRYRVTTPVADYSGRLGGLVFTHGEALAGEEHAAELAYARARGYGVEEISAGPAPTGEPADGAGENPMPRKSASTEAWRAYAVGTGELTEANAEQMTRDELVEYFTTEES